LRKMIGLAAAEERSFYWRLTIEQNLMFAGHGLPARVEAGRAGSVGAVDTNIFLAPTDASTAASSFFSTGKEIGNETFINRAWLAKQLSEIEAKSIIIILDSCYSGTEAFGELFDGMRESAGLQTPPLDPSTGGPMRIREVLTGVGSTSR